MYSIYDIQREEHQSENVTEEYVIGFAFHIVEDRAVAEDDDMGRKFQKYVENGIENFSWELAIKILGYWDYKVDNIN